MSSNSGASQPIIPMSVHDKLQWPVTCTPSTLILLIFIMIFLLNSIAGINAAKARVNRNINLAKHKTFRRF